MTPFLKHLTMIPSDAFVKKSPFAWLVAAWIAVAYLMLSVPGSFANELAHPLRGADTSSPRATIRSFINGCERHYAFVRDHGRSYGDRQVRWALAGRVLQCLDLSELPPTVRNATGAEAAICVKEVLDRILIPPDDEIPGIDEVNKAGKSEPLRRWTIPDTEIEIVRMKEGPRKGEYVFSARTVERALSFYERVKDFPYKSGPGVTPHYLQWYRTAPGWMIPAKFIHGLPQWIQTPWWGHATWQWISMFATLALGAMLMGFSYVAGRRLLGLPHRSNIVRYGLSLLFPIAAMLIPLITDYTISDQLGMSGTPLVVTRYTLNVIFLLAAIIVIMGLGNRVAELMISSPRIHPRGVDAHLIRLGLRFLSLVAAAILFLEGGQRMGIPLTTLLAGAGVGGLAFALAAQDTIKNFFGSVMVLLDKPFRVGDRIVVKKYDGFVEEIGLRSTRMRLLTGHLVTLPNDEMAKIDIENVSRRPHIRRTTNIRIPYDCPAEKVEQAITIVREILDQHEGMDPNYPPRVFLNEFNPDSINMRVIYWYHPPDYWDFLAMSERVNLQVMRQFEAAGIEFALPATTTFVAQDQQRPLPWTMSPDGLAAPPDAPEQEGQ